MPTFQYTSVASDGSSPANPAQAQAILSAMQERPDWDTVCVAPEGFGQFPFMNLVWHKGHGFEIQCFEAPQSESDFLASDAILSAPEVYVELGGQTQELWPKQLFVPPELAVEALRHFLESGRENPRLQWVRIDRFPRRTVRPRRGGQK